MNSCNRILNCISNPSTVTSWNSNIRAYVDNGCSQKALLLFRQMKKSRIQPNNLTFPFVAKACAQLSNLRSSEIIHTHVLKSPFSSDIFVQTAMIDMYIKCDRLDSAYLLFERMPERDVASWNVMIMGFSQLGLLDKAFKLFHQMRLSELKPDSITIMSLTQLGGVVKKLDVIKAVHCLGIRAGIDANVSVPNTWITAYAKCGDLDSAESVFHRVSMKTVVSWNSMIAGYAYEERFVEIMDCFLQMCRDGIRPEVSTILSLLSLCAHSKALLQGKLLHSRSIREGLDSNVLVINTLIAMYSKCGELVSARLLFNTMPKRTCVSWTAMIDGYAQVGDVDEAMNLFFTMTAADEKPDAITMVAMLSACSQTGYLELGQWMDKYACDSRLVDNVMVCNALVDMYAKCGCIDGAHRTFDLMHERTVVSWTTMIGGYAMNGQFIEALTLFSQMIELGFKPNHLTFLAILQACTHAGFLEKGWEYFNLMTRVYQIRPTLEHCACMADLLGRKGKLKEALEFIQNMHVEPDAGVWGALLGACRTHHEVEVAEYVANRLFILEPQSAVSYVAMANIYAAAGRWDGVAKIRAMMKCKGVRKSPGQSLVRVNGRFCSFTAGDRFHSEAVQIYEVLDGLALQLKEAGFKHPECSLLEEW
ncbi:hypothetical protein MRB53_008443 [Persea americana]|uniref:Uncharacterized protein n=1 Tax=Persea americana TaxID=3435 RepID=A0ACC2MM41_PERAE|nr:hypothetical protein MRB53_008443 [Persea americana]